MICIAFSVKLSRAIFPLEKLPISGKMLSVRSRRGGSMSWNTLMRK